MGMSVGYGSPESASLASPPSPNSPNCMLTCPDSSDEERLKLLDRVWELGCTGCDTADIYRDSEGVVDKWFKLHPERRGDIFLATKFSLKVEGAGILTDSSPEHCLESIERSLKRLNVDCADLYYMHRAEEKVPIERTVETMKQIVE